MPILEVPVEILPAAAADVAQPPLPAPTRELEAPDVLPRALAPDPPPAATPPPGFELVGGPRRSARQRKENSRYKNSDFV